MASGAFTVLAGDLGKANWPGRFTGTVLYITRPGKFWPEKIPTSEVASVEVAGQGTAKSFGGAAVAGLAGGFLLGPVGLLAGVLAGGNKGVVTFTLTLRDGRQALCSADGNSFQQLQAATFGSKRST